MAYVRHIETTEDLQLELALLEAVRQWKDYCAQLKNQNRSTYGNAENGLRQQWFNDWYDQKVERNDFRSADFSQYNRDEVWRWFLSMQTRTKDAAKRKKGEK